MKTDKCRACPAVIFVGNEGVHSGKGILRAIPHKKYKLGWRVSRSLGREANAIRVFDFTA